MACRLSAYRKLQNRWCTHPITGQNRTLYSMRHFYITQKVLGDVPFHVIAKQCGTSIPMLEKHYSHIVAWDKRKELSE